MRDILKITTYNIDAKQRSVYYTLLKNVNKNLYTKARKNKTTNLL